MSQDQSAPPPGPDLEAGVDLAELADGTMLLGHVGDEAVLLARTGGEVFAVSNACSHYSGPLSEGLLVGDTVRCPWHHACFDLRTGQAVRAPALNPIACWDVVVAQGRARVAGRRPMPIPRFAAAANPPASIVIVGAGAAGNAAAQAIRDEGYGGPVTLVGAEDTVPVDRPNLSKDYLAGTAPEEWVALHPPSYYAERDIALFTGVRAVRVDPAARQVALSDGRTLPFGALLLATGADPVRLPIPGADGPGVHYLRSLDDSRALIAAAATAHRAVVVGASFIGLEVAASLRHRGLEVHIVAPEARPLERIMGPGVADFVRNLHESKGVVFHLGQGVTRLEGSAVVLEDGTSVAGDLVVLGVGVRPAVDLAREAGLAVENGILVDQYLETSAPGIYAAGDNARYLDPRTGARQRIEHWVVAERQGQAAGRNMVGRREPFSAVPFFWSQHYDVTLAYVGHAERWDRIDVDGRIEDRDCRLTYWENGRRAAVVTIFRDLDSLRAELAMERA